MGILVSDCVLPSGISVSNVYMSFDSEVVYVSPRGSDGIYSINANYKVFKDNTKQPGTNIRVSLSAQVSDISVGVYTSLYKTLKQIYPDSVDC
jgi:hypothetical protein